MHPYLSSQVECRACSGSCVSAPESEEICSTAARLSRKQSDTLVFPITMTNNIPGFVHAIAASNVAHSLVLGQTRGRATPSYVESEEYGQGCVPRSREVHADGFPYVLLKVCGQFDMTTFPVRPARILGTVNSEHHSPRVCTLMRLVAVARLHEFSPPVLELLTSASKQSQICYHSLSMISMITLKHKSDSVALAVRRLMTASHCGLGTTESPLQCRQFLPLGGKQKETQRLLSASCGLDRCKELFVQVFKDA